MDPSVWLGSAAEDSGSLRGSTVHTTGQVRPELCITAEALAIRAYYGKYAQMSTAVRRQWTTAQTYICQVNSVTCSMEWLIRNVCKYVEKSK